MYRIIQMSWWNSLERRNAVSTGDIKAGDKIEFTHRKRESGRFAIPFCFSLSIYLKNMCLSYRLITKSFILSTYLRTGSDSYHKRKQLFHPVPCLCYNNLIVSKMLTFGGTEFSWTKKQEKELLIENRTI